MQVRQLDNEAASEFLLNKDMPLERRVGLFVVMMKNFNRFITGWLESVLADSELLRACWSAISLEDRDLIVLTMLKLLPDRKLSSADHTLYVNLMAVSSAETKFRVISQLSFGSTWKEPLGNLAFILSRFPSYMRYTLLLAIMVDFEDPLLNVLTASIEETARKLPFILSCIPLKNRINFMLNNQGYNGRLKKLILDPVTLKVLMRELAPEHFIQLMNSEHDDVVGRTPYIATLIFSPAGIKSVLAKNELRTEDEACIDQACQTALQGVNPAIAMAKFAAQTRDWIPHFRNAFIAMPLATCISHLSAVALIADPQFLPLRDLIQSLMSDKYDIERRIDGILDKFERLLRPFNFKKVTINSQATLREAFLMFDLRAEIQHIRDINQCSSDGKIKIEAYTQSLSACIAAYGFKWSTSFATMSLDKIPPYPANCMYRELLSLLKNTENNQPSHDGQVMIADEASLTVFPYELAKWVVYSMHLSDLHLNVDALACLPGAFMKTFWENNRLSNSVATFARIAEKLSTGLFAPDQIALLCSKFSKSCQYARGALYPYLPVYFTELHKVQPTVVLPALVELLKVIHPDDLFSVLRSEVAGESVLSRVSVAFDRAELDVVLPDPIAKYLWLRNNLKEEVPLLTGALVRMFKPIEDPELSALNTALDAAYSFPKVYAILNQFLRNKPSSTRGYHIVLFLGEFAEPEHLLNQSYVSLFKKSPS